MLQNKLHVFVARLIIVTLGAQENFSNEKGDTNLSININMNERFPIFISVRLNSFKMENIFEIPEVEFPGRALNVWQKIIKPFAIWRSLCHCCRLFLNYLITFKDTNDATEIKLVLSMNSGLNRRVNITVDTFQA